MDDLEKMLSFLCAERQRVEHSFKLAADRLHTDPDVYSFAAFERARVRMLYFREIESKLDGLLNLYDGLFDLYD